VSDIERRSGGDLERPPGAWIPVVVIGGLAIIGALSVIKFVAGLIFSTLGAVLLLGAVVGVVYVLAKGYGKN
jgi:hypothetical protein